MESTRKFRIGEHAIERYTETVVTDFNREARPDTQIMDIIESAYDCANLEGVSSEENILVEFSDPASRDSLGFFI